jgi:DNA polymerase III epsilon subunit-like protein
MRNRPFVPYRNRPKCFLDLETTGFIPAFHEITEIAIDHEKYGPWCVRVMPRHIERASERALNISRFNDADWADAEDFEKVYPKMMEMLEDTIIIGHNVAGFDLPFLAGQLRAYRLSDERVSRSVIDTQVLALANAVPRGLKRLSLRACCEFYGIEHDDAHNAMDDVIANKALYFKLVKGQQELF